MKSTKDYKIGIIGLGYVGLPLAVALARHYPVTGFDINPTRILELQSGFDRTCEVSESELKTSTIQYTAKAADLAAQELYIVTVPTPVTDAHTPDLQPLASASETIGRVLSPGAIVVYESTVYPGITEDFCGPILEKYSGLIAGKDFYLGYSPERINPGDKKHTVEHITKIVAGQTPEISEILKTIYGSMNQNNIFIAKNIKTAEAAKVIENAQRDINIAFVNEVATIVGKMGLSVYDVLAAANTKWNFLNFQPGLVGGHCIGVDPYYLAHCARLFNHEPEVILAGRRTNENMGPYIAASIHEKLLSVCTHNVQKRILILGLTFKEDIPDLRNTKVIDIIQYFQKLDYTVDVHDPMADPKEAAHYLNLNLLPQLPNVPTYDCVVGAVPHRIYKQITVEQFNQFLKNPGLIADIKQLWQGNQVPDHCHYWTL